MLDKKGSVWMAKFGKTLSANTVARLNHQIKDGTTTFLYLVGKRGITWFRATLAEVNRSRPEDDSLIPAYYGNNSPASKARLWFRATSLESIAPSEGNSLTVKSSGRGVADAMAMSMASAFIVVDSRSEENPKAQK